MEEITLALAILLGAGFLAAKIGQFIRLPSVTGYICVGLLLGPSGFNLITEEAIVGQLGHFTQIALMLIAFGIGEHLELKRLRYTAKNVVFISVADVLSAFAVVSLGMFLALFIVKAGSPSWGTKDYIIVAVLLGTVSMATAPAAILHVMQEIRASGRFTTSLLQIVAVDNGLAIMMFGIAVAVIGTMVGSGTSVLGGIASSITEIFLSLLMGVATGLLIDLVFRKLKRRGEMLTAGLALLLLCGEGARLLDLSPLLAGMAAGFIIVNRDHRDVRLFRVLNAFKAPIFVLFFTLAGAHLDLSSLAVAGWFGVLYFLFRSFGKYLGAHGGHVL
jgi:Kef-type K+ transport system membrane component KefB